MSNSGFDLYNKICYTKRCGLAHFLNLDSHGIIVVMKTIRMTTIAALFFAGGVLLSGLSFFILSCDPSCSGADYFQTRGFPFAYYFSGGIAGIQEFRVLPFLSNTVFLVFCVLALLLGAKKALSLRDRKASVSPTV